MLGGMAVKSQQVALSGTAQQLTISEGDHRPGSTLYVVAVGGIAYIGGPDVTTANGLAIVANTPPEDIELFQGEQIWAVGAPGVTATVLQTGI